MRKLLLAVVTMVFLTGATIAYAAPVEITFMNWSTTEDVMKPIYNVIEDFEKENPGIKVKNMPIGVGEIRNQFMVMTLGGNPPDVVQLHVGDSVFMYNADAVIPADDLYSKEFIARLEPIFYEETAYNGKHAAILWAPNTLTFLYNKKLFAQLGFTDPPKTLEEMEAMMKKGKESIPDLIGLQLDTTIRTVGFTQMWPLMNAFEYEVIKDKTVKFNSDNMVLFAEWLRRIVKEGYTLPGKRFGEFRPMAAQGRVLFAYDAAQHRGQMKAFKKDMTNEEYDETWEVIPLPMGPSGRHLSAPDDHALAISKHTKHKEAAVKFVEYLTGTSSALTKYHDPAGFLPPVIDYEALAPGVFNDKQRQGTLTHAVPNIVNLPFGPNYVKVATIVMTGVQEIITTDKPVKSILDDYQKQLEGVLQ